MFSRIKELLILGGSILLLGTLSCTKATTDEPVREADSGAVPVKVSLWASRGDNTKAGFDGSTLSWEQGDKLVLFDGSAVVGTLSCTSTSASGAGYFSGEAALTGDAPEVDVFFLGNRDVSGSSLTVDMSAQDGTASGVSKFTFLYCDDKVTFVPKGDSYVCEDGVTFTGSFNAFMKLTFSGGGCPPDSPGERGYKAKNVTLEGLTNQLTINLASKTATVGYANATPYKTTIAPGSVAKYANSYYLSVAPSTGNTSVTITADYQDGGTGTTTVKWESMNWGGVAAGSSWFYINWTTKTFVQLSSKLGYYGQAVTGGENADSYSHKGGYNGSNADGENENPTGNKVGYGGTEVLL